MKKFIVEKEIILFDYLKEKLNNLSKNSVKNLLHDKYIYVNDVCITKYDYLLKINDVVSVKSSNELDIIYEDNDIIVVNKKEGLLTISTGKEKNNTLYNMVSNYVKRLNKKNKIFIINRIDKDTSGIVMLAKSEKVKNMYQDKWNNIVLGRHYYAIVEGKFKIKEGKIESYLFEDKNYIVHSCNDKNKGKLAITEYKVIKEKNNKTLLDINIKTGRKNQIRVHMKENNTPIIGDNKYGIKSKGRMYLHAYKLEVINPKTNKKMIFETKIPNNFILQ